MIAIGLPASPGAAVGQVVFTADNAEEWHAQGKSVILVILFSLHNFLFFILLLIFLFAFLIYLSSCS